MRSPLRMLLILLICLTGPLLAKQDIKKLEALLAKNPDNLAMREMIGNHYLKEKNYQKTVSLLTSFSSEISQKSLDDLATAYRGLKDVNAEIRTRVSLKQRFPENLDNLYDLSAAYLETKNIDEAVKTLRGILFLKPDDKRTYEKLLDIFKTVKKNNYESQILVKDMIARFGESPTYLAELCRVYAEQAFLDEALGTCQKALGADPKNPNNHVILAGVYWDKGNKEMHRSILVKAAKQFDNSEMVQFHAGTLFLNEKNFETSARYFQQAVKADPKVGRSQLGRARSEFAIAKYDIALEAFTAACKLDKKIDPEFRLAESQLRRLGKSEIAGRYSSKISSCR